MAIVITHSRGRRYFAFDTTNNKRYRVSREEALGIIVQGKRDGVDVYDGTDQGLDEIAIAMVSPRPKQAVVHEGGGGGGIEQHKYRERLMRHYEAGERPNGFDSDFRHDRDAGWGCTIGQAMAHRRKED